MSLSYRWRRESSLTIGGLSCERNPTQRRLESVPIFPKRRAFHSIEIFSADINHSHEGIVSLSQLESLLDQPWFRHMPLIKSACTSSKNVDIIDSHSTMMRLITCATLQCNIGSSELARNEKGCAFERLQLSNTLYISVFEVHRESEGR